MDNPQDMSTAPTNGTPVLLRTSGGDVRGKYRNGQWQSYDYNNGYQPLLSEPTAWADVPADYGAYPLLAYQIDRTAAIGTIVGLAAGTIASQTVDAFSISDGALVVAVDLSAIEAVIVVMLDTGQEIDVTPFDAVAEADTSE